MLAIDLTFIVIFLLVWILVLVLTRVFFKPVGRILEKRHDRESADREAARAALAAGERDLRRIEDELREARATSERLREELEAQALAEKARLVADVQADAREQDREGQGRARRAGPAAQAPAGRRSRPPGREHRKKGRALKSKRIGLAAIVLFMLLFAGASPAEEGAAAASSGLLAKTVNFLILFGGLGYVLYKPVRALLEKNSADARHSLEDAAASRTEAEGKREEAKGRLDGVAAEIERMKSEAASRGRLEKDRHRAGGRRGGRPAEGVRRPGNRPPGPGRRP